MAALAPEPPRDPPVRRLARALLADRRWGPNVAEWRDLPARQAQYGEWPQGLAAEVREVASRLGVQQLYRHQALAIEAALAGRHVVVASGTASGKSLCFVLPILDALVRDPRASALLIFPTKALAHDQLASLEPWRAALAPIGLRPAAYDGDTPRRERGPLRTQANLLFTNPDMLHTAILPRHTEWHAFFEGLRFVVLDEAHVYRGVFGSHTANVLRRLRRIAAFYGRRPQFLMASATIANPRQLGQLLAGGDVAVIDLDSAPRGPKTFVFYNPPVVDAVLNLRQNPLLAGEALARHFLTGGVQTIVFCRSRQAVELMVRYLHDGLQRQGASQTTLVRGYRGGYLPLERRAIEAALRDGSLRGVVATNALELGIDIGSLDACILIGYPGTIASTWQQAGRAGRRSEQAIAILVASSDPLDQFIVRHPEYFFGRSPEHALANPDNPLILLDHLRCALFELPFQAEEASKPFGAEAPAKDDGTGASLTPRDGLAGDQSGPAISDRSPPRPLVGDLLPVLEAEGVARRVGDRWFWLGDTYPAAGVSLRSCGPAPVEIVLSPVASDGSDGGEAQILGTVELDAAAVTVHEGAIYLHDGAAYRVERLDWQGGRAYVVPDEGLLYSVASSTTHLQPVAVLEQRTGTRCSVFHGMLKVRSRAMSYRLIRLRSGETVGWGTINLPESVNVAGAYWFTLEEEVTNELAAIGHWRSDAGDRGPNWAEQRDRARARDGYACAVCRTPEPPHRAYQVHHIRPFSTFGWQPGKNEAYRAANDLDNLITLCPACHRLAERTLGLQGGLAGIGHALSHLAPLFLMCDRRDLAVHAESCAAWTGRPTITIFERAQAGVGFGQQLYQLHDRLLLAAADLIAECPCEAGCPSCVGPSGQVASEAKKHAQLVLRLLVPGHDQP